jgi:hypothetical protein
MPPANIETDPFFVLLTDALRAGPQSPAWRDAVAALRTQGLEGADEHRLLIETRESLESGRDYRSVRAGAAFTRKVLGDIEAESAVGTRNGIPTATIVTLICGLLIIGAIVYISIHLAKQNVGPAAKIDDLETRSQAFLDKVSGASFSGSIPSGWKGIGSLELDSTDGLRPKSPTENKNLGGGVVWTGTRPGDQPFAVDVTVSASEPSTAIILEAFVTTDPNFSADKGTSSHDLIWQLRGREQRVLVNGAGQNIATPLSFHSGDTIRLIVGPEVAIVEIVGANGAKPQRLWAGTHELGAAARSIGVRFLQTEAPGKTNIGIQQIKVTDAPA